ncbi:MAG TPA: SemiSWEET family transporter [Cyclobacteriaceae bacterium]|jgi:MtN3 and saliva related transmembrane protein|nr:SemiSWEET family transporter [Cyclobacteriaceae bacterium]
MTWVELAGHTGSVLSSITFIPQVYKVWKSKRAEDLSVYMLFIIFSSTIVWIIYGVSLSLAPVYICNGIICVLSLMLIYFKFSYKK